MLVRGDKREQVSALQFYLDQDIAISGAMQIISANASARMRSVEALNGEARVTYKVIYKIIYKNENGISCHEESFDYTATIKSIAIEPKSFMDLTASVIAVEYVGVTNIKLRSTIEIKGYVVVPLSFVTPDIADSIHKKATPVIVESINPIKESEIIASGSFDLKEAIDSILSYDTQIMILKVASATEICEIKGECYTYITYLANGSLNSRCLTTPFNAEILTPFVKEGSSAYCTGYADSTTVNLAGNSGEIKIETVVSVKGFSILKQDVEILTDVYSRKKELNVVYSDAYIEDNVCLTDANEKISGSARINEDKKRIRSVLSICPPSVGAISVSNIGGLSVEGIISVSVVYLDEDENIENELVEIPYHFMIAKDFPCQSSLSARAVVSSINARARHNDEIEVTGDLCIEVYGSNDRAIKYISSVEESVDREENETAITLYLVKKGEALWDVAKALLTDEETLLQINPNMKLPLMGGEKIILYRELN